MINKSSKNLPLEFWVELTSLRKDIQDVAYFTKNGHDPSTILDAAEQSINDMISIFPSLLKPAEKEVANYESYR